MAVDLVQRGDGWCVTGSSAVEQARGGESSSIPNGPSDGALVRTEVSTSKT